MKRVSKNYAFIDSQNLNLSVLSQGWTLDMLKFRIYLRDKYAVSKAFVFIGYVSKNIKMYEFFESVGYTCIFKPTTVYNSGKIKGNCDGEMILQAMIEYREYDKAIIVSGDGDFYCLVNYLIQAGKLEALMIPNSTNFSSFYKNNHIKEFIRYVDDLRSKLEFKKERPHKDETL